MHAVLMREVSALVASGSKNVLKMFSILFAPGIAQIFA
jgi:hypothetical protein